MNARYEGLVELCQGLIRLRSVSGDEGDCVQWLAGVMRHLGYDEVGIDAVGNLVGAIDCGKGPCILFDGHIDTVGVDNEQEWTLDPFGGEVVDGYIYGRGASDMKGSLAAMVWAIANLDRNRIRGKVLVSATVLEEPLEGVALLSVIQDTRPDFVVIGEATGLRLNIGQRGRAEIVLETFGKPAHSANPSSGDNAVYKMVKVIESARKVIPPHDALLGDGILELTDIISTPYPGMSVVPSHCRVTLDRRLVRGDTRESILASLRDGLYSEGHESKDFRVSLATTSARSYTGYELKDIEKYAPPWWFLPESEVVVRAKRGLKKRGIGGGISTYSFCTNGSGSAGVLGIPTIGFGPCDESMAHTIDERISIRELCCAAEGFAGIAEGLAGLPEA